MLHFLRVRTWIRRAHINLRLCNYSLSPVTLAWSLAGLPGGSCPGANANGPTTFSPATGTVTLGPATSGPTCVNIPVRIQIPGSYVATDVGCYEVTVKNLTTGSCCFAEGEVRPLQIVIGHGNCCAVPAVPGAATPIGFTLGNNSGSPQTITYRVSENSSDGDTANQVVSLNGLPPGTPYFGQLDLAPGDSGAVNVQAVLGAFQPLNINEVVLSFSASGAWDAVATTALESMTSEEAADTPVLPGPSLETAAKLYAAPNPFQGRTAVRFTLNRPESAVRVSVFDVAGRRVRDLHVGPLAAGDHQFQWDGLDSRGERSPKGLYFIRVQAPGVVLKTKIVRMD